jgi:hypothetical protein
MPKRRGFPMPLVRVVVLAGLGIVGCIWALVRAYRPRPPMVVPIEAEAGPSEIPVPDLEQR